MVIYPFVLYRESMPMILRIIALLIGLISFSSSLQAQPLNINQVVQSNVVPFQQQNNVPGIAVDVYYNGKPYFKNFGVANLQTNAPITNNTIFELASVSKLFTATLAAIEIDAGAMQLNAPISTYIKAFNKAPNAPINKVTIKQLATHTASLPRMADDLSGIQGDPRKRQVNQLLQALLQWQPAYPLGTRFVYSNIGFGLLGVVVENATGKSYQQLLQDNIATPLGMNNTIAQIPNYMRNYAQGYTKANKAVAPYPNVATPGGGGVRSTPADMMQFLEANLGVLSNVPDNITRAIKMTQQPYFQVRPNFVMGLGWQRITKDNQLFLTKNGLNTGFNAFIGLSPDKNIGVVVLVNKRGTRAAEIIGRKILFQLCGITNL
jgi:beta-lactamase class C